MEKEGKVDIWSILIASILILVVYAVMVLGNVGVLSEFPENTTNASASFGYGDGSLPSMTAFNGTSSLFRCNVSTNDNGTNTNITNVSLFLNRVPITNADGDVANVTFFINDTTTSQVINMTLPLTLAEGTYSWICRVEDNQTPTISYNTTNNRTFTIDLTPPGFTNLSVTSNSQVSTEDTVFLSANFSDQLTSIHTVRLFVNTSGTADNEVNITDATSGVTAGNGTQVNLSFKIAGGELGNDLNFTFQVNDSVNNINITTVSVVSVSGDGTPPGITLNSPISTNQTSTTAPNFNFTAVDNNNSASVILTCAINISLGGSLFTDITNIKATNGTLQSNTTTVTLSDGVYSWNVSCIDPAGNKNTSLTQSFTVDNLAPALTQINLTNNANLTAAGVYSVINKSGSGNSLRQGATIFLATNLTDNLTQPLKVELQFLNTSSGNWEILDTQETIDTSAGGYSAAEGMWGNASFVIPTGHNEFEGTNVSFRAFYNDTLGNSNTSVVIIAQINDTSAPTITINKPTTNLSNFSSGNDIEINWTITENNPIVAINWSVDDVSSESAPGCQDFGKFNTEALADPKKKHNFTLFPASCSSSLSSDFHKILIQARDSWGNVQQILINFTVDTQAPTIAITPANNTNMTSSSTSITVTNTDDFSGVPTTTWTTSCSGSGSYTSGTAFFPFNDSSGPCSGASVQTLTITATDQAGNSNVSSFLFGVDDTAPTPITSVSPTDGESVVNDVMLNYTAVDDFVEVSFIGYYLDSNPVVQLNFSAEGLGSTGVTFNGNTTINLTGGNHTIIYTANDTVGNFRNSSTISFVVIAPIPLTDWRLGLNLTLGTEVSTAPVFRVKNDTGDYNIKTDSQLTNETYEIIINVNSTGTPFNVTLTDLDGSSASWDKINSTYIRSNNTQTYNGIQGNWTNTIIQMVYVNGSLDDFAGNTNKYYGTVTFPVNISGNTGLVQEFWWLQDETNLQSRESISQCSSVFSATDTTPCWNYTSEGRTIVFVPHFSIIVAVNDSGAPTITVNKPDSNQTVSTFLPNITVTSDTITCKYLVNGSTTNTTMTQTGTECIGSTESFKNLETAEGYNITFFAEDSSGNIQTGILKFNISDNTAPNNGTSITSSGATTGATITVNSVNESITNITLVYGTSSTALSLRKSEVITATKSPSIGSLGISTVTTATDYFYNVTICDFNNNCKTTSNLTFTQSVTSPTTTTTTTTTTTGGGGGGAAVSNVADSKAQVWSTIPAGSSVSLNVDKATIAITSVAVNNVKSELKNVDIEVQALKSNPVSATAAGKVFQYLRINKKKIADGDAESIKIGFRVTKAWLTENGLTSADVRLYRYKNSVWNKLSTSVKSTDSTYVNFEAETPGFSFFAVGSATGGGDAFAIIDAIRGFYAGTSSLTAFEIIDMIRAFYG